MTLMNSQTFLLFHKGIHGNLEGESTVANHQKSFRAFFQVPLQFFPIRLLHLLGQVNGKFKALQDDGTCNFSVNLRLS